MVKRFLRNYLCKGPGYIRLGIRSSCVSDHGGGPNGGINWADKGPCGIAHRIGLHDSNCMASAKPSPLVIVPGCAGTDSFALKNTKNLL